MKKRKSMLDKFKRMDIFSWILYIVVVLWVVSMIYMLYFAVINSLKYFTDFKLNENIFGLPTPKGDGMAKQWGWQWSNYINIFRPVIPGVTDQPTKRELFNFFRAPVNIVGQSQRYAYLYELFFNSILYAVAMTLCSIATEVMVAYTCAKYDFKLGKIYYAVGVIVMLIPIVGSMASELRFADIFNLENSIIGICILKCKYPGLYFLVFYATFKSVSSTYMEAAELDGAGHFQIFWQIMFPLVKTSTFAIFILLFITNWNDYFTPLVFMSGKPVMSYALYRLQFNTQGGTNDAHRLAACVCSAVPIVVLFVVFRNKIMGNVTMGGIKG